MLFFNVCFSPKDFSRRHLHPHNFLFEITDINGNKKNSRMAFTFLHVSGANKEHISPLQFLDEIIRLAFKNFL